MEIADNVRIKGRKRAVRILRKAKERGVELQVSNIVNTKDAVLMAVEANL